MLEKTSMSLDKKTLLRFNRIKASIEERFGRNLNNDEALTIILDYCETYFANFAKMMKEE